MEEGNVNKEQTCSFKLFTDTECNSISPLVFLKDCNKPVASYLKSLNISYDDKYVSEGLLICMRVGIFTEVKYFTVCEFHRASLGLKWKRRSCCMFPERSGKCKGDRPVSTRDSYALASRGILLPIGSAICKFCRQKLARELESFPEITDLVAEHPLGLKSIPLDLHDNDNGPVVASETQSNLRLDSEPSQEIDYEDLSSLQADSEINASSIPSSQISSWSIENNIHCNSLDALQIICDGKISPIKYQIRKDLDDLKPRTLRSLKRKATVAVQETLDILAPSQAKKVWQLIDQEMESKPPKINDLVIQLYQETNCKNSKIQFLSMIAKDYTKEQLKSLIPGVTTYAIDKARRHAKEDGKGVPLPEKEKKLRCRMDRDKLDHALIFF